MLIRILNELDDAQKYTVLFDLRAAGHECEEVLPYVAPLEEPQPDQGAVDETHDQGSGENGSSEIGSGASEPIVDDQEGNAQPQSRG